MAPKAEVSPARRAVLVLLLPLACAGERPGGGSFSDSAAPTVELSSGPDGSTTAEEPGPVSQPGTAADSEAGTQASTGEGGAGSSSSGSSGGQVCADMSCSDDLQAVTCGGLVMEVCDPGTLCVDGACAALTPCEEAAAMGRSEGCEFYAVKTELLEFAAGSCFAAFVANTGEQPVRIGVEYDGETLPVAEFTRIPVGQGQKIAYEPFDAYAGLAAGEVAILFLSRGPGDFPDCPAPPAIPEETAVVGSGLGKAFRITTDAPVAAYQMLPYGGGAVAATSATLLLPTGVWDTRYVAVDPYEQSGVPNTHPLIALVAAADDTVVTLDPRVAVEGNATVQGGPAGVPITYTLQRGETLQIGQAAELVGSTLVANRPFGLFGGSSCMNIPKDVSACDGAHQQLPPVRALGSEYAAVRHRNRVAGKDESPPWRLVGAADGTLLAYVPEQPKGAPDALALGEVVEFSSSEPFLVRSQDAEHPFYLAAYMTGGADYDQAGDPEWVNVIPTAQYLERYVFFTDPTYPDTSLVVVRNRRDGAFAPVELDCAGALGDWKPLGDDQEWTRVDLVKGNFEDQGGCSNGRHEIRSDNPLGVTVWGWGTSATFPFNSLAVSYAYPAGAAVKSINAVVIEPG